MAPSPHQSQQASSMHEAEEDCHGGDSQQDAVATASQHSFVSSQQQQPLSTTSLLLLTPPSQLTQGFVPTQNDALLFTQDEGGFSNLSSSSPLLSPSQSQTQSSQLTPQPPPPWGRLIPCSGPTTTTTSLAYQELQANQHEYWLGRSATKSDISLKLHLPTTNNRTSEDRKKKSQYEKELTVSQWAHSMISNKHCRIMLLEQQPQQQPPSSTTGTSHRPPTTASSYQVFVEDQSGNGTFVNQTTHLHRNERRLLHSGDEICLVNPLTLRKRIGSQRLLNAVLQHYSFVFVQSTAVAVVNNSHRRTGMVNPRAMNYHSCQLPPQQAGAPHPLPSSLRPNKNHKPTTARKQQRSSPTTRSTSPPPRRIEDHYDIREVLGDGTSGQVRRAIHQQTGHEYAVKVISLHSKHTLFQNKNNNNQARLIMDQEVRMLQALDHPYIVKLSDVFCHEGVALYLVMEWIRGGDLFDGIVSYGQYPQDIARKVVRRLLSALYYLHEVKQVVHRDLKPENILLQQLCTATSTATNAAVPSFDIKLADFGLAKRIQDADGLKTFCGTPQYFAPEVLQRRHTVSGVGRYGKPADMWSLGVIVYILLVGRPPFDHPDENTANEQQQQEQDDVDFSAPVWKSMPLAQELVSQLLRWDPKRRLSVRQACDHAWFLQEDGDSHLHPLDDPTVAAHLNAATEGGGASLCKRLFASQTSTTSASRLRSNSNINSPKNNSHEDQKHTPAPAQPMKEDRNEKDRTGPVSPRTTVVSKEQTAKSKSQQDVSCVMSKEEFAAAAIPSHHQRENSGFHCIRSSSPTTQEPKPPTTSCTSGGADDDASASSSGKNHGEEEEEEENGSQTVDREPTSTESPTPSITEDLSVTGSPEDREPITIRCESVTPDVATPVPLTTPETTPDCRNDNQLHERGNQFRRHIIDSTTRGKSTGRRQQQEVVISPSSRSQGLLLSSSVLSSSRTKQQLPVTPTAAANKNKNKSKGAVDDNKKNDNDHVEEEEDVILSQFSTDPEDSLHSFPESPVKENTKPTKSRKRDDCNTSSASSTSSGSEKKSQDEGSEPKTKKARGGEANATTTITTSAKGSRQTTLSGWFKTSTNQQKKKE